MSVLVDAHTHPKSNEKKTLSLLTCWFPVTEADAAALPVRLEDRDQATRASAAALEATSRSMSFFF